MNNSLRLSSIVLAMSFGISTVFASMTGSVSASIGGAGTYSNSVDQELQQLAKTVDINASVASEIPSSSVSAQVLRILRSSSMDWNEVLFGTDNISAEQQTTSSSLVKYFDQLLSMEKSNSTTLITSIMENMQSLNHSIQSENVVALLRSIVGDAYSEIDKLGTLNPLSATTVSDQLHVAFDGYLSSSSSSIQALFGYTSSASTSGQAGETSSITTTGVPTPPMGSGHAFSAVLQSTPVTTVASSTTQDLGNGVTVDLKVPADAFSSAEMVTLTTGIASDVDSLFNGVYANLSPAYTFGVSYSENPPSLPITLTITSPSILSDAEVFKVNSDGSLVPASSVSANGMISISFRSTSYFVIATTSQVVTPPIVLPSWPGFTTKSIELNGNTVYEVPSFINHGTTYMPLWYVMQTLQQFGYQSTWDGVKWSITTPNGVNPDFTSIKIGRGTGVYVNGQLIERAPTLTKIDPTSKRSTTYMPIWYVQQVLDRMNIQNSWNSASWIISIPNQTGTTGSTNEAKKNMFTSD